MSEKWEDAQEFHERMRWARAHVAKHKKPIDAARALNIRPGTYRTYEVGKADDGRIPPISEIQRIARLIGVSWPWLATGDGSPYDAAKYEPRLTVARLADKVDQVPDEKREDAIRAAEAVLESFAKAG